ncbi:HAD family hydrolase [Streptomyces sp. NPDC007000]|uniref:HAD family hydrolase n=1 Tax=Streptomyces sp. NPDC007000 TaxID=3155357 RepID=UPI003403C344
MTPIPPAPWPDFDAILFDIDDTLVATRQGWELALHDACRDAARHAGATIDPARLAASYQDTSSALWADYNRVLAPLGSLDAIRRHVWNQALAACGLHLTSGQLHRLVTDFSTRQLDTLHPDAHLIGLLHCLAAHVPLAIISNGPTALQREKLTRAGLDGLFHPVLCGLDDGVRKPDPHLYWRACSALNTPPDRCLYIGDDWTNDIVGAHKAGLHPIWIQPDSIPPHAGPAPIARFPTITACASALLQHLQASRQPSTEHLPSPVTGSRTEAP